MVHAFVMVEVEAGMAGEMLEAIRDVAAPTEAHIVAGDYDLIVEIDSEEIYDVLHTSSSSIQILDGVEDTKTYISLD